MTTAPLPDAPMAATMLQSAIEQIRFARTYTLSLLDETPQDRWFEIPDGLPTNVAWQVGHLTVSQYGLLMFRIRGRQPEDLELIPGKFRKAYSRQSVPNADPGAQPSAKELLERMSRVYDLALAELEQVSPDVLLEETDLPWTAWPIKLGAILFCPLHEHIHAGQIGIIRRAIGLDPVR
jgi:hypothetical protein